MSSLPETFDLERTDIPEWAPGISCGIGLSSHLNNLDFGYEDMGSLVESRNVSKRRLRNLQIHFTDRLFWHEIGDIGICRGAFYNERGVKKYSKAIREVVGITQEQDLKKTSYIFVHTPTIVLDSTFSNKDPAKGMQQTLIHELEHFCEYEQSRKLTDKVDRTQRAVQAAFLAEVTTVLVDSRFSSGDAFYPSMAALVLTGIAAFKNRNRAYGLLKLKRSEEDRVFAKTSQSMASGNYALILEASVPPRITLPL